MSKKTRWTLRIVRYASLFGIFFIANTDTIWQWLGIIACAVAFGTAEGRQGYLEGRAE